MRRKGEKEKSQTKSQAFIVARVRSIDVHTPRVLPTIVREGERERRVTELKVQSELQNATEA